MWCVWLVILTAYLSMGMFLRDFLEPIDGGDFLIIFWPLVIMYLTVAIALSKVTDKFNSFIAEEGSIDHV